MSKFKRELRYIVLKWKDIDKYLTLTERAILFQITGKIEASRHLIDGKQLMQA